mmetsp:Transcript_52074/g.130824  ORF Transcript_52074/g.130824 Transcript_52074/m.130824 type:complete len:94 (+) Transcript_52074:977-1258(+)
MSSPLHIISGDQCDAEQAHQHRKGEGLHRSWSGRRKETQTSSGQMNDNKALGEENKLRRERDSESSDDSGVEGCCRWTEKGAAVKTEGRETGR